VKERVESINTEPRRLLGGFSRRDFFRRLAGGLSLPLLAHRRASGYHASPRSDIFWIRKIPDHPFTGEGGDNHIGIDSLLQLMGDQDLKFYRSSEVTPLSGPEGLIAPDDVVLVKVNAQWKYRGCTNSDLVRGLIRRILDHPDVFTGEVVIIENGQGRGSLNCDTSVYYEGDRSVRANANDESHTFLYLVDRVFRDPRVSAYLLDTIRSRIIGPADHSTDGYRTYEDVSYPCFTTAGGFRVELKEGVWRGDRHTQNLKLINVPVLKHHDTGGSEITASLKHFYGILSMSDGVSHGRHYDLLGQTVGKMVVSVAAPVLNIVDAVWVSHGALTGYPESATFRANQILASQDPVALDYWAAKYVLYPFNSDPRHHSDFPGIDRWLVQARDIINDRGGLLNEEKGIRVEQVTKYENEMRAFASDARTDWPEAVIALSSHELDFLLTSAGGGIPQKILEIRNSGAGNLTWRLEKEGDWFECSPSSGSGAADVMVRVSTPDLEPGIRQGTIRVHAVEASNSPQTVSVRLTIREVARKAPPVFPRSGIR